jgi:PAS domain S-box-containing protein
MMNVRQPEALSGDDLRRRAEEALRVNELSLHAIVESIPGLVAVATPDGEIEYANRSLRDYFGRTLEELQQWRANDLHHPDDLSRVVEAWGNAVATGSAHEVQSRRRRADGVYRWLEARGFPLRDSEGRIVRWCLLQTDIEDRMRAEALLAGEKRLLEMVAGGQSLADTLEELCRFVESTADWGCHCSVLLADSDGTRLEQIVSPGMPASFRAAMTGRPVIDDSSPSSMACCRNEQVIASDLASETRWASDWRPMALAHGVRACWSTPFSSRAGKVLGAFAIYYDEPRTPTTLQRGLIDRFTNIAAIAVERAQSDAAVMSSEARKAAILDSSLDSIITIDHEGRITEFNHAAERTLGFSRDWVIGKSSAEVIVPPSLRERHRDLVRRLVAGESRLLGRRIETSARRADGSEISVELAITRMASSDPPSFTGFLRDITKRKRAVEGRERAETQLAGENRVLEMIASGRSLHDVLGALCRFVEEAAALQCGIYPIDWSGPIFHSGVAPSLPRSFLDPIEGLAVRGDAGPCGIAALTKTQVIAENLQFDPRWAGTSYREHVLGHGLRSVWSTPIFSLDGEVLGTFAMYRRKPAAPSPRDRDLIAEVTHIASIAIERAHAEAALKRSEAFLAEGERLSLTGTFAWRVATNEITWSEQIYRIFEFDPGVPMTFDLALTRLHPEDLHSFQNALDAARAGSRDFEYEQRLQMPGGAIKYLHVVAHRTRAEHDQLEYIGAVQDVTERRLSEEVLGKVRSEVAHVARVSSLGTLTASIAHEVNQPLSGIITNAGTCLRMLDGETPNLDGARETARRTIRDGHRAAEVIARLRALFGKKDGPVEPVDLNEATREVIALSRSELQRNRVVVKAELAADLPPVSGDRVQLQQVILNLLLNASDAMRGIDDRPRQAVIATERDEVDSVRVTVRDSGEGLEPQVIEKVFEPFYTTKSEGMGIGLAVSRSIIERHRGHIWATLNDGPGATFSFSIPLTS